MVCYFIWKLCGVCWEVPTPPVPDSILNKNVNLHAILETCNTRTHHSRLTATVSGAISLWSQLSKQFKMLTLVMQSCNCVQVPRFQKILFFGFPELPKQFFFRGRVNNKNSQTNWLLCSSTCGPVNTSHQQFITCGRYVMTLATLRGDWVPLLGLALI